MSLVETVFFTIFSIIYNPLHSHFATYCLILVLGLLFLYINGKAIKKLHRRYGGLATFTKWWLVFFEVFVLTFLAWFVFIYFHTFRLLESEYIKPMKISHSIFFSSLCLHILPIGELTSLL
jgi:hypothetical protein